MEGSIRYSHLDLRHQHDLSVEAILVCPLSPWGWRGRVARNPGWRCAAEAAPLTPGYVVKPLRYGQVRVHLLCSPFFREA